MLFHILTTKPRPSFEQNIYSIFCSFASLSFDLYSYMYLKINLSSLNVLLKLFTSTQFCSHCLATKICLPLFTLHEWIAHIVADTQRPVAAMTNWLKEKEIRSEVNGRITLLDSKNWPMSFQLSSSFQFCKKQSLNVNTGG